MIIFSDLIQNMKSKYTKSYYNLKNLYIKTPSVYSTSQT